MFLKCLYFSECNTKPFIAEMIQCLGTAFIWVGFMLVSEMKKDWSNANDSEAGEQYMNIYFNILSTAMCVWKFP